MSRPDRVHQALRAPSAARPSRTGVARGLERGPAAELRDRVVAQPVQAHVQELLQRRLSRYFTMRANSSGSRLAPPTSAPSISGWAMNSRMLPGFTLPPYWTRTARGGLRRTSPPTRPRIRPITCAGVGRRGVAAGPDGPDRLVGDDEPWRPARRRAPASAARTCPTTLSSVRPASRSSSVSPTHRIGIMPCAEHRPDLPRHDVVGLAEQLAGARSARRSRSRNSGPRASRARSRR